MEQRRLLVLFSAIFSFVFLTACGQVDNRSLEKKDGLVVMTTFYPLYEFTKEIVQERAEVKKLIPLQVSPHDWEPTPKEVKEIYEADVLIYSSEHFETWIPSLRDNLKEHDVKLIHASEGIRLFSEDASSRGPVGQRSNPHDPHVWLSPVLAQKLVKNIAEALREADVENEAYYAEQRDRYLHELAQLDDTYRTTLKDVRRREFITEHEAFGYLAKEYGLQEVPIAGLSPSLEPSAARLSKLKGFAEQHGIHTIYYEELSSSKTAETLAKELGARLDVLITLEGLTKEQERQGLTYIDMMMKNLQALEASLK